MKKILFATEFSEHSPEVFKFAADIAYFFNARLEMIHSISGRSIHLADREAVEHLVDTSMDRLIKMVQDNLPDSYRQEVQIDYLVKKGAGAKAILDAARSSNSDLIVMGMTGKTNAIDQLLGSVSLAVLQNAKCPVLLIPPNAKFEGIDNIVYTAGFEFRDFGAVKYLKKWSKKFKAPIHCLHVLERGETDESALKNMELLKETLKGEKHLSFDVKKGGFQKTIEEFSKEKRADLIAMVAHKRSFLASLLDSERTAEGFAKRTNIPLLVLKDDAIQQDEFPKSVWWSIPEPQG